jgi:glycosyltransferase involved in cell wall biosynthesis
MCVLPNQQRAERFAQEMANGKNVLCVWNCPTQEEIGPPRQPHNGNKLWVLYHGSIVPARLPLTVLYALTRLPTTVRLRIIGYETVGHRGYVRHLQEMTSQLGLDERVQFLGAIPTRGELLAWCQRCEVGLAFMPKDSDDINEQAMTGASNKPFDYLACGLALLVADLPDWHKMYVESGYGLVCNPDDPESVAVALRWFLDHPDAMRKMGERGRKRIAAEWNYETQFAPVWQRMHEQMP